MRYLRLLWPALRDGAVLLVALGCSWALDRHYGGWWFLVSTGVLISLPLLLARLHLGQGFVGHYRKLGWALLWLALVLGYGATLIVWTIAIYW